MLVDLQWEFECSKEAVGSCKSVCCCHAATPPPSPPQLPPVRAALPLQPPTCWRPAPPTPPHPAPSCMESNCTPSQNLLHVMHSWAVWNACAGSIPQPRLRCSLTWLMPLTLRRCPRQTPPPPPVICVREIKDQVFCLDARTFACRHCGRGAPWGQAAAAAPSPACQPQGGRHIH